MQVETVNTKIFSEDDIRFVEICTSIQRRYNADPEASKDALCELEQKMENGMTVKEVTQWAIEQWKPKRLISKK